MNMREEFESMIRQELEIDFHGKHLENAVTISLRKTVGGYSDKNMQQRFEDFSRGVEFSMSAQAQQEENKQRTCPDNLSRISPVVALASPAPEGDKE